MYAVKQRAIKEHVYKKRFPIPILAREFFSQVLRYGRTTEGLLIVKAVMKANPFAMFKSIGLGLKLMRTGRMSFAPEKIRSTPGTKGDLHTILRVVKEFDSKESKIIKKGLV